MKRGALSVLFCMFLISCKKLIQYHPDQVKPAIENLNLKNITRIKNLPLKDTFSFAVIGDPQRFYDDLADFISNINSFQDISFLMLAGDISDFGLNREFNLVAEKLEKLKVPFIAAIGNHDMLANGEQIFRKMFGPDNFSFNYGLNNFVVFNSNSREAGFDGTLPDMSWIRDEVADYTTSKNIFFLSHIPPFSPDFDRNLEMEYASFVSSLPNARLSMHGHEHHFMYGMPYNDNFPYLIVPAISKRSYVVVTVMDKDINVTQRFF